MQTSRDTVFVVTQTGEPHARRRAAILRELPHVRKLFGYDPRTAAITGAVVVGQFAVGRWLQGQALAGSPLGSWWFLLLASYLLGAVLSHWLAMTVHECSHNLALRTPQQNIALSIFANLPMVLPCAMTFRRYHIDHHAFLGVEGKDTDLPDGLEVRTIGNRTLPKFLWLFFYLPVYMLRGTTFAKPFDRGETLNLALMVVVNAAIYHWLGGAAFAYLALSTYFGHSLHPVAAHFIHEHYTFQEGQETYSYYGVLNRVAYNVGYHNEHHDFMNVPGSRLPELKAIAPGYYTPLKSHRSWTWVLWRFITSPEMSAASRIVRSRDQFERGRKELSEARLTQRHAQVELCA